MRRLFAVLLMVAWPAAGQAAPDVVVSVKPLHALVAAVMQGVGTPALLLEGNASPHVYALKPSEARRLSGADLVFVVGGGLEAFLDKALARLGQGSRIVRMAEAPDVKRLPLREGGLWAGDDHDHRHAPAAFDPHLWLDPANAIAFADAAAAALADADPAAAATYRANAAAVRERLRKLDEMLADTLAPARGVPYLVFHDAYHYLEDRYGLTPAGSVSIDPERQPGARRVRQLQDRIAKGGVRCLFREPQFSPRLVEALAAGGVKVGVLDAYGADLPAGADAYEAMMRRLAEAFRACLAG